uniref:Importin N-terminal domain-containing protein n=1 Tax=Chaetoceros debilis TaxID=122233 RepID=A0A7S3QJN0_9STRA|mmetsp:Transcript_17/g.37  ORF Transcript_17/g.37 Transcript_17/m.37 type:complete len:1053 (+) Transcript_17:83-3241(+)|eukprot:CAMPEP_0194083812 /NCGR_PEP_ID=MMETSP0149-20130528/9771_1 /TAXON_ID=122233 /ORGANISM="Chaetoceros debilis, Strain MM31A-1" /LENGTH=1052 /DNA_ID=CAMNT_0038766267 /DNA_START=87 /DNA_END=3245 /DNA_ORIENTATION=-
MNTEALHVALQQSFSPDANLRLPAEKNIKNLKNVPGAAKMLLEIAAEQQVQYEIRQAASIQLKNLSRECWQERTFLAEIYGNGERISQVILSEDDKDYVRLNLVNALLAEPQKSIQDLMAETLHSIAIHDFPQAWPTLLPTLLQAIALSNDGSQALRVHNALLALRKVCKRYEFKQKDDRGPLNDIVAQAFPLLLPLAQRLCNTNELSIEAAMMLKQVLKIFWSSTQFYLPGDGTGLPLSNPTNIQPWFEVIQAALAKPLPEEAQPKTTEERNAWPWWKVKKWSAQIMSRLFSRYGVSARDSGQEAEQFATFFTNSAAPQFLGPICETLNLRPSGKFCTDRVVHLCLSFLDVAIELAPTYKMLKPHQDFLLYQVCFPTICLSAGDIELFETDPHEFVHRENSPLADFYDPRMSAITLVSNIVKYRGKYVVPTLLSFLQSNLQRYSAASADQKNPIEKDGTLLILGNLADILFKLKKYRPDVEGLLVTNVFPDFNSPVAFLRSRACWMIQRFSFVNWTDDGTHLRTVIELVLRSLSDPALPVQIEASKALKFLIEAEGAEQTLLPILPKILEEYFRIMNEIGNDDVIAALQSIIDRFGDHIEPHAIALVTQLTTAFNTYCDAGEDDDDALMAASQCLECIATVLKGIHERPELYRQLEPTLLPVIRRIISEDGDFIEYIEYALEILTFLTYFPEDISNELYDIFPLIYVAFDQWAFDYLGQMVPPVENFIGKNPSLFVSRQGVVSNQNMSYVDMVFSMITKTLTSTETYPGGFDDPSSDYEMRKALSLYMSLLLNCKGMLDNYLPSINDIVLAKLAEKVSAEIPLTRIDLFIVIGSALLYNPQLELMELEKRGVTQQVLSQWFRDAENMDKWLSRKVTVVGFCSILQIPTASLPESVKALIPQIIVIITKMTAKIEEEAKIPVGDEDDGVFPQMEEKEDLVGFDEDQDVHNSADDAYLEALNLQNLNGGGDELARFLMGDAYGGMDDDDDDEFISPLDEIETLQFYKGSLSTAFGREPVFFQEVQQTLPQEIVQLCQQLFVLADVQAQSGGQN